MTTVPSFGSASQFSDIQFLLNDLLNGMGDFLTQEVGSLNWIECYVNARALASAKQFITLISNQLSPNSSSVYLDRWATIYNTLGLSNPKSIQDFIELKQSQYGMPPILSNMDQYLTNTLGEIFIDVEVAPELQVIATTDPVVQLLQDGYIYKSPLSTNYIYVWQPRDNQDNLLMPDSIFNPLVDSYLQVLEKWCPSYNDFITMNLTNRGFQDGYCDGYNGGVQENYLDGYNVVSGSAGSTTLTGIGTAFQLWPDGEQGDFDPAVNAGYYPPIQIVDDLGVLQTYFVSAVASNTSLTITVPLVNSVTKRTYRTLGIILDTNGVLDGGSLFHI